MKRVLYIWQADYPWDVRVEKLCTTLRDAGSDVVILARWKPGRPEREQIDGMTVLRVGYEQPSAFSVPVSWNPLWRKAIVRAVDEFSPTLIIPREILLAEAAARCARRRSIPVVMDMAEHYPAAMREWKKYTTSPLLRFAVRTAGIPDIVERRSVHCVQGILTVCNENSTRLHRQYGIPFSSMQVVGNTPGLYTFSQVRSGCTVPPVHFAHHGFMTAERGLDTLVRGFALVLPSNPALRLTLAGEGESFADIRALVHSLSIDDAVHLPGRYTHRDLASMYSTTDIGVLPYWNDEFRNHTVPNKLFDYMACGKPVLVSESRPMKRIVEETGAGLAVDCTSPDTIAEGITAMLGADVQTMGNNGLAAFRATYNWEEDARNLLAFLRGYC